MKFEDNKITKNQWILGYEEYFKKDVYIGVINHKTKEVRPCHGYFYPHQYGKKLKRYAKKIGYNFNNN